MHIMLALLVSGAPFYLADGDGKIHGPYDTRTSPNAAASKRIAPDAFTGEIRDRRGCYRLRWTGSSAVVVPLEERRVAREKIFAAWRDLADLRAAYAATKARVDADPSLREDVLRRIAEAQDFFDDLTRPGDVEDEP